MYCIGCRADLRAKPKINIEGDTYCYRCAKNEVPAREAARRAAARNDYEHAKSIYDREKAAFDKVYSEWRGKRSQFVGSGKLGCGLAIVGAVIAYYAAEGMAKGFGFVGVIVGRENVVRVQFY